MTGNAPTRRQVLGLAAAGAVTALAGCGVATPDECSPATFPPEGSTHTREDPPTPCQFGAELEQAGLDVDSTMGGAGHSASVMYYHEPDRHSEQIRTVAVEFVRYRRMISSDGLLSFTALSSNDDRHGDGHVAREWADSRASGDMTREEYVQKVEDTYETR